MSPQCCRTLSSGRRTGRCIVWTAPVSARYVGTGIVSTPSASLPRMGVAYRTTGCAGGGQVTVPPDDTVLAPFFQVCPVTAPTSHFPPNFLAGNTDRCRHRGALCGTYPVPAGMWDLPSSQRPKSPMPPQHAGSLEGTHLAQWTNGLLKELRPGAERRRHCRRIVVTVT